MWLAVSVGPASAQTTPPSRSGAATTKLSFNQSIQPILSENCYACHGPDPGARKAKLRLDRAEFAYAPHDKSGPAIIPGQPEKSPLVQKIEAKNPKDRMPPPEAHKTLKPEQIALLRAWVKQGAVYEEHWSFIAPKPQSPVPHLNFAPLQNAVSRLQQSAQDHDQARRALEKTGKSLSPEAAKSFDALVLRSERALTREEGLPRRPWYKHIVYAPGFYTGYGVKTLPGIREAIEERKWEEAEAQTDAVARALDRYAGEIEKAAEVLRAAAKN